MNSVESISECVLSQRRIFLNGTGCLVIVCHMNIFENKVNINKRGHGYTIIKTDYTVNNPNVSMSTFHLELILLMAIFVKICLKNL